MMIKFPDFKWKKKPAMSPQDAFTKADIAQKRIPELEHIILQNTFYACNYAMNIIEGRWPEAETIIMNDAGDACWYARDVIQGRWLEAESTIMYSAFWASCYAQDVICRRWSEAEEVIAKSKFKDGYIAYCFGSEPIVTKDEADIIKWERKNLQGYFAPASLFEKQVSFLDMMVRE